ncbi:ras and EF-hand domain-containing protein homolog isoform X5 [Mya arenaria]|uniref:ras and EF-hand domain-containing protein homolog isoform X5 n=1 Tax=Mya arenaria TaxID=6604 RepID=UPI0022E1304D|nr:ras and EF-hand domain-containing protein homolog isoform X5 [Mya arenaria]
MTSCQMDRAGSVSSLFRACDLDGSGYIDEAELANICPELSNSEVHAIFVALDKDGDGKIGKDEFSRGFREISDTLKGRRRSRVQSTNSLDEVNVEEFIGDLDEGLQTLSCQEQVVDLYQQLHQTRNPTLLETFEAVILSVLRDLRQQTVENDRLEKSFKREKEQHERHMRQMEDEMEVQVQRVEQRARHSEEEKKEAEMASMREKVQEEITMLQQNLKKLQQEGPEVKNSEIEEQLLHLKGQVEEMTFANRQLRSDLTDAQTNLALVKGELANTKQQISDKAHEVEMEKETICEYQREQENLTRQLHLLHDANKRLHDTNDDLREAMEAARRASPIRQQSVSSNASTVRTTNTMPDYRRGSLMSEYFQSTPLIRSRMGSTTSLVEEPEPAPVNVQQLGRGAPRQVSVKLPHQDTCESDGGVLEDIDSGHSTLREGNDVDGEQDTAFLQDAETMHRLLAARRTRRPRSSQPTLLEDETLDDTETESEFPQELGDGRLYRHVLNDSRRLGSASSRSSSSRSSRSRDANRRQSTLTQDNTARLSKEPERMFKVVLAGDAAVGKSSLIMRLCKGKFYENLSSTLGVDFQTKMIELDGRTVALQLWDTAGQERFRSIAKSYFRRADGVLLLYDVTYERSFMSIREWMDSIEDGSIKKLPIMLCANKTDMRTEADQQGRKTVSYDDGQRLAREYCALFIETSAKDGTNIGEAVSELTRLMRANEDLEVKTCGLQLHDKAAERNNGCCSR